MDRRHQVLVLFKLGELWQLWQGIQIILGVEKVSRGLIWVGIEIPRSQKEGGFARFGPRDLLPYCLYTWEITKFC